MKPPLRGKPGFSTIVITPWGRETYQVWVEHVPPAYVARIVTLPNRIWASPGGREAIKFHGVTANEAEQAAAAFIEEERILNKRRIWKPAVNAADRDRILVPKPLDGAPPPAERFMHRLLLRFGIGVPQVPGLTANLSESGLFIITDRPGEVGAQVRIDLRFPDLPILLGGEVVWVRSRRDEGALGCGIKLVESPGEYLQRIRKL
jgi:hypothetical protein